MSRKGDVVHFKAADNLYVNDVLVLPKGATGVGEVKRLFSPVSSVRMAASILTLPASMVWTEPRFPLL